MIIPHTYEMKEPVGSKRGIGNLILSTNTIAHQRQHFLAAILSLFKNHRNVFQKRSPARENRIDLELTNCSNCLSGVGSYTTGFSTGRGIAQLGLR